MNFQSLSGYLIWLIFLKAAVTFLSLYSVKNVTKTFCCVIYALAYCTSKFDSRTYFTTKLSLCESQWLLNSVLSCSQDYGKGGNVSENQTPQFNTLKRKWRCKKVLLHRALSNKPLSMIELLIEKKSFAVNIFNLFHQFNPTTLIMLCHFTSVDYKCNEILLRGWRTCCERCHYTQHYDIQHNDTHHSDTQRNNINHYYTKQNDIQHNDNQHNNK
jgi:hypothetical protein